MYYTIEDGKENCIEKIFDKNKAIQYAKENQNAKEVFEFNEHDELIGCIWSK